MSDTMTTERAVSPVIGVILMVAITVILAAVIGTFVLDLGQSTGEKTPPVSFGFEWDSTAENVVITHEGGVTLKDSNSDAVSVRVAGSSAAWTLDITAGDTFEVGDSGADLTVDVSSGDTVRVVWTSDSDSSQVLASFDIP